MRTFTPKGVPVAVVGIGCRFPAANGPAEFWQLLSGGGAITEVPPDRYDIDAYGVRRRAVPAAGVAGMLTAGPPSSGS